MIPVYWLTQTAADIPADTAWLAANEIASLSKFRFAKRREDWLLGRWTAKRALATYFRKTGMDSTVTNQRFEIFNKPNGAPMVLLDNQPVRIEISMSHRSERALCAIAPPDVAVGADLEVIEEHSERFVEDYFTDEERSLIKQAALADLPLFASLIWSAKESALKALQVGLRADTRSVEVSSIAYQPVEGWSPLSVREVRSSRIFQGWFRQDRKFLLTIVAAPAPACPIPLF